MERETETQTMRRGEALEVGSTGSEGHWQCIFALTMIASAACAMPAPQFRHDSFDANAQAHFQQEGVSPRFAPSGLDERMMLTDP
jgi:hypothetical protein